MKLHFRCQLITIRKSHGNCSKRSSYNTITRGYIPSEATSRQMNVMDSVLFCSVGEPTYELVRLMIFRVY